MSEPIWTRAEIDSPCVQVCVIHPQTKLCTGCARSAEEIRRWSRMTPDERQAIMEDLTNRSPAPKTRRGGRAARMARRT